MVRQAFNKSYQKNFKLF